MPTVDFGSGYRDATKGATLKALQLRRQEAAEAQAQAMQPRQIASPWQGAAQIAETIGSGIREGRAAADEQAGRARFAELLAGGLSPEEMGEATVLDPDIAMKYQENTWQKEAAATTEENLRARELMKNGWDVAAATERARVEAEAQQRLFTQQSGLQDDQQSAVAGLQDDAQTATAGLQDDQQAAAIATAEEAAREADKSAQRDAALKPAIAQINAAVESGRMTPEDGEREIDLLTRKAEADIAQSLPETVVPMTPEEAAKWGGDIAKNPQNYKINTKTGEPEPIERARKPGDIEATGKFEKSLIETRSTIANLRKAKELSANIFEGSGVKGYGGAVQRADAVLKTPSAYPEETVKQATATRAYFNIMGEQAIKAMGSTLAGATTEYEMKRFTEIMANEATPLSVKIEELDRMLAKVEAYEKTQIGQVSESGGDPTAGAAQTGPAPAPAPEAASGGGAEPPPPPAFDPAIDEEGDTGSDEFGKLKVINGKWTRI